MPGQKKSLTRFEIRLREIFAQSKVYVMTYINMQFIFPASFLLPFERKTKKSAEKTKQKPDQGIWLYHQKM
ncbi:MAG TPA: hypothetical protein DCL44_12000 [Elusimicrobia bacterium]|nr:hypothetical protein [Elusimicrobiota bacterium]